MTQGIQPASQQLRIQPLVSTYLRDARATPFPLKRPPVVTALEASLLIDSALGKGRKAVGALVQKAAPLGLVSVEPEDDRLAEDGKRVGDARVHVLKKTEKSVLEHKRGKN